VLDYPRFFSREEVFAIRSFFWWGHYFSISLHLKGKFCRQWLERIQAAAAVGKLVGGYLSCSGNEFSFNLSAPDYLSVDEKTWPLETGSYPFLKISFKISFDEWEKAEQKLMEAFERLTGI